MIIDNYTLTFIQTLLLLTIIPIYTLTFKPGPIKFIKYLLTNHLIELIIEIGFFTIQLILLPILAIKQSRYDNLFIIAGLSIMVIALIILALAKIKIGNNWGLPGKHNPQKQKKLITTGIYQYSRNPIYLSALLLVFGFELAKRSLLILFIIPLYIYLKNQIKKEEIMLQTFFGNQYMEYKEKTPRFIIP